VTESRQRDLMLAPFLVGVVAVIAVPALTTFALSLYEYSLIESPRFVGLDNFRALLEDPLFAEALENSLVLAAIAVPLRLAGALGLALLLARRMRFVGTHRTIAYLPTVVPETAYALLWLFLLNPLFGPVNGLLGAVGLPQPEWLTDPTAAMAAMILIAAFTVGEGFIVALAVRQELPGELYDLARLEGASPLAIFRRVTLPLMAPVLGLLALRDVAFLLQISFAPAYLLTDGGPDVATLFLPLYVFDVGFEQFRYGYAAAMTLTMFLVTLLLAAAAAAIVRTRGLAGKAT
jgi:multiple sugar transport system permease protein